MPGVDRSKVGGVFRVESGDEVAVAAVTVCSVAGGGGAGAGDAIKNLFGMSHDRI